MEQAFALTAFIVNPTYAHNRGSVERAVWNFGGTHIIRRGRGRGSDRADTAKAHRHLPVIEIPDDPKAFKAAMASAGFRVVAVETLDTSLSAPVAIDAYQPAARTVFMLGNETCGLSVAWQETADDFVTIPMARPGSLNVAQAAVLCLHAASRDAAA